MYEYMIYPTYPPLPTYATFPILQYLPRAPYPKVDTKIFKESVKSYRFLMEQASLLLDRLGDSTFAYMMMDAAQQGKKTKVESLIKSIGLKVPLSTEYTPSGVIFTLHSQANQYTQISCCSLTISMKWGS
jgi:hypothetical protein